MQVKCSLCGGETEIHPGQEMLSCSFCGSALAPEEPSGPEHLILPHARSDRNAREALISFLLAKRIPHPKEIAVDFSYVPYFLVEEKGERTSAVAGVVNPPGGAKRLPYPPAGSYRFFDESLAGNERIMPAGTAPTGTFRLLHLPLYRMRYRTGGKTRNAAVVGESWIVYAGTLPPEQPSTLDLRNVLIAACIFTAYLFIGAVGHGWLARFVLLLAAAAAGFIISTLRARLSEGR